MMYSAPPRAANLLDQRFVLQGEQRFELKCSLMLAEHGVYLADLAPETFQHICHHLRSEAMQEPT